jgi:LytTr DNA-binding domain
LTSGGDSGPSGGDIPHWRKPQTLTALVFIGFGLIHIMVNATSLIEERRALGQSVEAWQPWVWEATSFLAWLLLLPAILWVAGRAASIGRTALALAVHLCTTIPVSLGHTAVMLVMRKLAYAAVGETYVRAGSTFDIIVYEYRKDAITYALIIFVYLLIRRLAVSPVMPAMTGPEERLIEVRDGSRSFWLQPEEIEWVAAAGNYLELHGVFGTKLARRTLAEMESELGVSGFVRVHRSRLVRKAAIVSIETQKSGDFEIVLRSGQTITGSRRYRSNIARDTLKPYED